ncbi:MAG: STAS/SEC14 domain-containing protein [Marinobacter sp.]|uniref:STAS/SEC14 domain-containing protein n=1 Tax=Marinobacter sp. TaxID=50741 RepID=UPI00299D972A|nr:STAS/SEC14 domain-containing protein [Marinobacter sp.]MDX1635033.1 STAS/SEC14 domain-containing protein [Marinobacter sp.]
MMDIIMDEEKGIAVLSPSDALTREDFEMAAQRVDDYLEKRGELNGMIISTRRFPGWKSFGALLTHLRFIRQHHREMPKVAIVTDSALGELGEHVADHFVSAEVRHFDFDAYKDAERWIQGD